MEKQRPGSNPGLKHALPFYDPRRVNAVRAGNANNVYPAGRSPIGSMSPEAIGWGAITVLPCRSVTDTAAAFSGERNGKSAVGRVRIQRNTIRRSFADSQRAGAIGRDQQVSCDRSRESC